MSSTRVTVTFSTWFITFVLVVLKLCNVINWSLWWVLSPAWIELAFFVVAGIVVLAVYNSVQKKNEEYEKRIHNKDRKSG